MPDQPTQSDLDTAALEQALRYGRHLGQIADALWGGGRTATQEPVIETQINEEKTNGR